MVGEAREKELQSFLSGDGWYRGVAVDSLSQQEAGIIAARLVRRIQTKVALSNGKATALESAFTDAFKRRFIREPKTSNPTPQIWTKAKPS
ncbi:MAG: hypothetical protein HY735_01820 [Verrucomicrobia bacterium]|nr:hypothetical protein [Verrucomicrobiota bacterium]